MLTLDRIRKTQAEKERAEKERKENYKSPSGFTIMARFMKDRNKEILNSFCNENEKSNLDREIIIEKYHKLNFYTPCVTSIIKNEEEQFNN